MLPAFNAKYGPVIGGAIGVVAGIWIVRQQHTQSVVVSVAEFLAALIAGIVGGYLMRFLDGSDHSPNSVDKQRDDSPVGRS